MSKELIKRLELVNQSIEKWRIYWDNQNISIDKAKEQLQNILTDVDNAILQGIAIALIDKKKVFEFKDTMEQAWYPKGVDEIRIKVLI